MARCMSLSPSFLRLLPVELGRHGIVPDGSAYLSASAHYRADCGRGDLISSGHVCFIHPAVLIGQS
jgi:hypothetical protein